MHKTVFAAIALAMASPVSAHVVFDTKEAVAGGYHAGFLRVGHGCDGAATVVLRVSIPDGITSVRPQPKPGWEIEVERADGYGRVVAIAWRGRLEAEMFDQFGLLLKLPDKAGPLYFPTVQQCEGAEKRWTEIPPSPEQWHEVRSPAPMLVLREAEHTSH